MLMWHFHVRAGGYLSHMSKFHQTQRKTPKSYCHVNRFSFSKTNIRITWFVQELWIFRLFEWKCGKMENKQNKSIPCKFLVVLLYNLCLWLGMCRWCTDLSKFTFFHGLCWNSIQIFYYKKIYKKRDGKMERDREREMEEREREREKGSRK